MPARVVLMSQQFDNFVGVNLTGDEICRIPSDGLSAIALKEKMARAMEVSVQAIKLVELEYGCDIAGSAAIQHKDTLCAKVSTSLDKFIKWYEPVLKLDQCSWGPTKLVCEFEELRRALYKAWATRKRPHKYCSPATQWFRLSIELLFMKL